MLRSGGDVSPIGVFFFSTCVRRCRARKLLCWKAPLLERRFVCPNHYSIIGILEKTVPVPFSRPFCDFSEPVPKMPVATTCTRCLQLVASGVRAWGYAFQDTTNKSTERILSIPPYTWTRMQYLICLQLYGIKTPCNPQTSMHGLRKILPAKIHIA